MAKSKLPATQGLRALKAGKVDFTPHTYKYEEKGGTSIAAVQLDVDEHRVIKTLIMEDEKKAPLIILMHGDCQVSAKALARAIKAKTVTPCNPEVAGKHTGYMVGGTSPFGTRKKLPVYVEASILDLDKIFINAGKKGLLVEISPSVLTNLLNSVPVDVARPPA